MGISVIIPFFNEWIYINQTLASLSACDVVEEIILVDDRPCENKPFLATLATLFPRITVHHNDGNIGAAASRNNGLSRASASHVLFLDSDDFISPTGLEQALEFTIRAGADMTHMPTMMLKQDSAVIEKFPRDRALFGQRRSGLTVDEFPQLRYAAAGWSFLFNRQFIQEQNIRFDPIQRKFEDHLFILKATQEARSIACFDEWVHIWRHRGGSLSAHPVSDADFAMQIGSVQKSAEFLGAHYDKTSQAFQIDLAFCFLRFFRAWPLLSQCLATMYHSDQAHETLEKLACALENYKLLPDLMKHPIAVNVLGSEFETSTGTVIPMHELPDLFDAVICRKWQTLATALGIDPRTAPLAPVRDEKTNTLHLSSDDSRLVVIDTTDTKDVASAADIKSTAMIEDTELSILVSAPTLFLWHLFLTEELQRKPRGRLFSEYVSDELPRLKNALDNVTENTLTSSGDSRSLKASIPVSPAEFVNRAISQYQVWLRQSGTTVQEVAHAGADGNHIEPGTLARDVLAQAIAMTNAYIQPNTVGVSKNAADKSALHIAAAWRSVEQSVAADTLQEWVALHVRLADDARYGDADPFGRRTVKSRIKAFVKHRR